MQSSNKVIAIDGPAASGKSSVSTIVSEKTGFLHVNSGLMYRALTWSALRVGIDPKDESNVPEENTPDLLQVTPEQPTQSKTLMVAETEFFNQRNQDYWQRKDLSHLRPYDFPYVRALIHQKPCDTLQECRAVL